MNVLPALNKHSESVMPIKNTSIRPDLQRASLTGHK